MNNMRVPNLEADPVVKLLTAAGLMILGPLLPILTFSDLGKLLEKIKSLSKASLRCSNKVANRVGHRAENLLFVQPIGRVLRIVPVLFP
jgi:hypothetical protein